MKKGKLDYNAFDWLGAVERPDRSASRWLGALDASGALEGDAVPLDAAIGERVAQAKQKESAELQGMVLMVMVGTSILLMVVK